MACFLLHLVSAAIILFFSSFLACAQNSDLDGIRAACRSTAEPDFCFYILSLDSSNRGKDIHDLTAVAINLANVRALAYRGYITNLQKKTQEPVLKGIFEKCSSDYYTSVVDNTAEAIDEFGKSDYRGSVLSMSGAASAIFQCNKSFATKSRENVLKDINATMIQYLAVGVGLANNLIKD